MPPLPMVVGADGVRRHLVGAGIVEASPLERAVEPVEDAAEESGRRPMLPPKPPPLRAALPSRVLERLSRFDPAVHPARAPAAWLAAEGFNLVHDSGVERLMLLVRGGGAGAGGGGGGRLTAQGAALAAWRASTPTYTATHYSPNAGVAALLVAAAAIPGSDGLAPSGDPSDSATPRTLWP
jgi:hypothetical protein